MQKILNFSYKGYLYDLFKNNGSLVWQKTVNGESVCINNSDKELLCFVLAEVLPSSQVVSLKEVVKNGIVYAHFLDKKKGYHLFYEKTLDGLKYPAMEDRIFFNQFFNNQMEKVFSRINSKQKDQFSFKRIVKVGSVCLVVFISSLVAFPLNSQEVIEDDSLLDDSILAYEEPEDFIQTHPLPDIIIDEKPVEVEPCVEEAVDIEVETFEENEEGTDIVTEEQQETDNTEILTELHVEDILLMIRNNPQLSDDEKEFFMESIPFFEDNLSYFDMKTVIDHLNPLSVHYVPERRKDGTLAEYFHSGPDKGKIVVYGASNFEEANKASLDHEFGHVFTRFDDHVYGNGIYEGLHVVMNNEYSGVVHGEYPNKIYDRSYGWFEKSIPFLCEIIDADVLKRFHADANPQIIIDALMTIISDKEMAYQLVVDFDFVDMYHRGLLTEGVDYKDEYANKLIEINTLLKTYYEAKYQTHVEDHLDVFYYYDSSLAFQYVIDSCGLDEHISPFISPTSEIVSYKSYLNPAIQGNELILKICSSARMEKEYCSVEELLEGPEPYASEEEIPFEKMADGTYEVYWFVPDEYKDFNFSTFNRTQRLIRE